MSRPGSGIPAMAELLIGPAGVRTYGGGAKPALQADETLNNLTGKLLGARFWYAIRTTEQTGPCDLKMA